MPVSQQLLTLLHPAFASHLFAQENAYMLSITTHKEQPPPYLGPNMFQHIFTGFNPKLPEIPSRSIPHDTLERWQAWVVIVAAAQGVIPRSFPSSKQLFVRFHFQRRCCWLKKRAIVCWASEWIPFAALVTAIWLFMSVGLSCSFQDLRILDLHTIIFNQTFYSHRTTTLTLMPTGFKV